METNNTSSSSSSSLPEDQSTVIPSFKGLPNSKRLEIPVSFGLYSYKDDPLADGDYQNSKKLMDVLRKLKEYADAALGRDCEPSEDDLPVVISVTKDASFVPQAGQAHLFRYHCKAIIAVNIYNDTPTAIERASFGVRSALKMVLDEGWIS